MQSDYRSWLELQGYSANTISTQASYASRVEQACGDLDEAYSKDRIEGILASLKYSSGDMRRGAPNPSKIQISGDLYKTLASCRTAIGLYRRFRDEGDSQLAGNESASFASAPAPEVRERLGLERDLQKSLRQNIVDLEEGLTIVDEGAERPVPSGYVDITARDGNGTMVVIELKAGTADRAAIGQILSYMGDIAEEEEDRQVRGILVAHRFDERAKAAARVVPNLKLRSYSVRFDFSDPS